jgi:nucleoside-diphosphate-sugar epimerase
VIASVTGGSGMVGRRIVRRLLSGGHQVRVLSRGGAGAESGVELFQGSLQDDDVLGRFIAGADMVFHCAAELRDESKMWRVNVGGTERLLRCVGPGRCRYFCYVSSAGVVGKTSVKWVGEDTPCAPQNVYEKSKWAAEQLVARGIGGCNVVILRPTNVIDEDRPGALAYPLRGSWLDVLKVVFKGGECAHIVHADDVAAAAIYLMERRSGRPRCFFVSCDEDPANTFAGLWSLYMAVKDGHAEETPRPMPHLPLQVPYLLRRLWRGAGNHGAVRYSSRKLLGEGFVYGVGVRGAVMRLASGGAHE